MKPRRSKPALTSVVDLGLRDVGVRNQPRRLAAHFGKAALPLVALVIVSVVLLCALLRRTGADAWVIGAFAVTWPAAVLAVALRTARSSPVVVVRVDAGGTNHASWLLLAPFALLSAVALLSGDAILLPVVALSLVVHVVVLRNRKRVPELLRELRPHLAGEPVLGDGIGLAKGRRGQEALRAVVATERRLLVAGPPRPDERFPLVEVTYGQVSRFEVDWKVLGRIGELSLTIGGDTHVVTQIAPANLLSIGQALLAHGVGTDDAALLAEAGKEWDEARRRRPSPGRPRATVRTRDFDRGLWLLIALAAFAFYVNPFGVGLWSSSGTAPLLIGVIALSTASGYVAGTRASLAYLVPLNLLIAPAFFFFAAGDVVGAMVVLTAAATVGLCAGSALRRAIAAPAPAPAGERRPAGSLRAATSGMGLVRLSAMVLAAIVALVGASAAAGFEIASVRMAFEEATGEQLPVDGRSDLNGGAASLTYTPGPGLREFVTDEHWDAGPHDGARWELRSRFTKGYNVVTLAHYIFEPRLDDPAAVAGFVAGKDAFHTRMAGSPVTHTERVVDGRKGYVWDHGGRGGYWYFAAWFPQPVHSVRLECIAKRQERRFKRLCAEALASLEFHP